MTEENDIIELEFSEDDIVYYIFDEDDNEIGFAIEEDGKEVEYYYAGYDEDEYEFAGDDDFGFEDDDAETSLSIADLVEFDGETVEMEISEEDIDHYLFDEEGNEIGFVIIEDGVEVECYYQDEDDEEIELVGEDELEEAPEPEEHGYLYKMAQIVGHEANKTRKKAQPHVENARDKATAGIDKVRNKAEAGVDKATEAVEEGGKKLKEKKDEYDLGITREGVSEATADLNAIAKEGAATAKELKEAYDDIMDSFGAFLPKSIKRKLP